MILPSQQNNSASEKKQVDDWKVKNAIIHTMQKDLDNPNPIQDKTASIESPKEKNSPSAPIIKNTTENSTRTSPFLTAQQPAKNVPTPENNLASMGKSQIKPLPANSAIQERPVKEFHQQEQRTGRSVVIVAFLILIAGLGAYYFITVRNATPEASVTSTDSSANSPSDNYLKNNSEFYPEKPNYLIIDLAETDQSKIKETLSQYADKVAASNISSVVEFLVIDPQKNPIEFSVFSDKINLTLSTSLSAQLEKSFSLFLYNDNGKRRLGLSIDIEDEADVRKAMIQEEESLAEEIESLFMTSEYHLTSLNYSNSQHDATPIRYSNITSPEDLSIDYAVSGKKLIIGTTKMTLRSILDYYTRASN